MVLYVLLGLIVIVVVWMVISHRRAEYLWSEILGRAAAVTVVSLIVSLLICGIGALNQNPESYKLQSTYTLRALVTNSTNDSSASGAFFLGFGSFSSSSKEVASIAYIQTAKDGGSTLQRVDVNDAVIYEGAEAPRVEEWAHVVRNNKIFVPWDYTAQLNDTIQYRFHIPKGTILTHYEIVQ